MGIYNGDIHYGIKISKKVLIEDATFLEPIYEMKFVVNSISLDDYLNNAKNVYLSLLEPHNYQYELLVDIFTTYNGIQSYKGWQTIKIEQMKNFIDGMYKIDFQKVEESI